MSTRPRRGSQAIEFALLSPVWLMLLSGIVDYGWYGYHRATLNTSVHIGCRAASILDPQLNNTELADLIHHGETAMEDHYTTQGPGCGSDGCDPTVSSVGAPPSRSLTCSMETNFEPIIGLVMDDTTLRAATVMRMEYQRFN